MTTRHENAEILIPIWRRARDVVVNVQGLTTGFHSRVVTMLVEPIGLDADLLNERENELTEFCKEYKVAGK